MHKGANRDDAGRADDQAEVDLRTWLRSPRIDHIVALIGQHDCALYRPTSLDRITD